MTGNSAVATRTAALFGSTQGQMRAREIMGRNFFGIEEAVKHFRLEPQGEDLKALVKIPFSKPVLEECKGTHILVAVFPLSIVEVRRVVDTRHHTGPEEYRKSRWYENEPFARDVGFACWRLIRKEAMRTSLNKGWEDQKLTLSPNEEVPTARVFFYATLAHSLKTGVRLFHSTFARCFTKTLKGQRVHVGDFESGMPVIDFYHDNPRFESPTCSNWIGIKPLAHP
ncbi:MAG: hypothetical protein AAB617_00140 [Patescibacteria group bacterium]